MSYPRAKKYDPVFGSVCPECNNYLQNAIPYGSPELIRCASCKTEFLFPEEKEQFYKELFDECEISDPIIQSQLLYFIEYNSDISKDLQELINQDANLQKFIEDAMAPKFRVIQKAFKR